MFSKVVVINLLCYFLNFPIKSSAHNVPQEYEKLIFEITGKNETATSVVLDQLINVDIATLLQMFDASAKIPDGLLKGNFFALGNYDECYAIESENPVDGSFYGKYCLGLLPFMPSQIAKNQKRVRNTLQLHAQQRLLGVGDVIGFRWGICIPSFMDIDQFLFLKIDPEFCYSKATEPSLDPWAIATIAILSFFGGLVVVSTVFDIILYYRNQKPPHELLVAFSFLTNGRKLFSYTSNSQQLLCLNGIKAISMMWVIIGHVYSCSLNAPLTNFFTVAEWQNDAANMFMNGATVSVDTFFTVGGLLTIYTFLASIDKGAKFNIFLYYIHRYLRLTPAFLIVIMVHANLLNYFGDGPLWAVVDLTLVKGCQTSWWQSILYITNYTQTICVPQTWYLTVDMQIFLLSPIVLIPLWKFRKIGLFLMGFLAVLGIVIPSIIADVYNTGAVLMNMDYQLYYYEQTHTRFGPYVIGMILGYVIYEVKKAEKSGEETKLPPVFVGLMWITGITGLVACVYAGFDISNGTTTDKWSTIFHVGFNRNAWAVALCIVIYLCVTGYGGPVNIFLSHPIFQFLSKVSYSMYLVHYSLIVMRISSSRVPAIFANMQYFHAFWGDFMFTLAISVPLCLTFESPIIILEKYLFGHKSNKTHPSKPPDPTPSVEEAPEKKY